MIKKQVRGLLLKARGKDFEEQYSEARLGFQEKHLENLLLHANHNVPYYNKIFAQIGIVKNGEVDLSRFDKIPILTKEIIRKHHSELISKDYTTRKWYYNSSGGSTGEPVRFIQDELYGKWNDAEDKYYYEDIIGIDMYAKKAILWGSARDIFEGSIGLRAKLVNWLTNTVVLNSFRITVEDMERYLKIINSYKPDLIRGYAGSLYDFCAFVEKKGISVHTPKAIVSAAETLRDEIRAKVENVFGTKVYDFYGTREVGGIAGECKDGLMHILTFRNLVEILDTSSQPVKEGEIGRVIVTSLHNYSMPFIRYEIEDMAIPGPDKCKCGNSLPTLNKVTGRITEHFIREDRAIISGSALTLTFNLKDWVNAFQIIQEDYKRVRILIVPKGDADDSERNEVESKIKLLMGQDCQIIWEFVDEIPKTQSGKYLYIKSLICQ